jgi:thiosulfate reductase cytochrome b subunit
MASITESQPVPEQRRGPELTRKVAAGLVVGAGILAALVSVALPTGFLEPWGLRPSADAAVIASFAAGALFLLLGGVLVLVRPGLGGGIALFGTLVHVTALIMGNTFAPIEAAALVLGLVGSISALVANDLVARQSDPRLIYRQAILTRVTHWTWAIALFFLLLSGLQIWNAHPALYIGQESGFEYENSVLEIGAANTPEGPRGHTTIFGHRFDTTGVLGVSWSASRPQYIGFPGWATIPSFRDLATGRVVHFFFAWILVGALAIWLIASLANRHLWRDIILKPRDFRELPRDILDHVTLRLKHTRTYSPLQKLAYFVVFIVLFPLIILTGLTMSPGMDAAWPWLLDIFGGRQTARTLHFVAMVLLVLFFIIHIVMVVLAGPFNELRSMITGHYRVSENPETQAEPTEKADA